MLKYLNLGCGTNYSTQQEWTNIDFTADGEAVIAHNLLKGIPFTDHSFDAVYHSHVLEHFSKDDGEIFTAECFRVLKPGGVLRIAVPDLETIVRNYLKLLDNLTNDPHDEISKINYEWMMLEMYDQAVRHYGGGKMGKYLFQQHVKNEPFVIERLGEEVRQIRKNCKENKEEYIKEEKNKPLVKKLISNAKDKIKEYLLVKLNTSKAAVDVGNYRLRGEVHQWMYDRYSLAELLAKFGGADTRLTDAFNSKIKNWPAYQLDVVENRVRKPDSMFMESVKRTLK